MSSTALKHSGIAPPSLLCSSCGDALLGVNRVQCSSSQMNDTVENAAKILEIFFNIISAEE
jgi:hypothetical protein